MADIKDRYEQYLAGDEEEIDKIPLEHALALLVFCNLSFQDYDKLRRYKRFSYMLEILLVWNSS